MLSERPAVGLHKRKRRTRGYEGVCGGHPLKQFEPVVGKEKESLVLFDRSAYPSAELVLDVFRPRGKDGHCRVCLIIVDRCAVVPVVEKVIGVQRGIAVLPVAHAVKSVGSRLLVCRDEGPCATAVLSAHAVGKDGKILDRLERRVDIDGARAEVVIVFRAVEHVRGAGFSGSARSRRHVKSRAHRRRHKGENAENVTVDKRSVLDGGAVHLVCEIRSGGLHKRGLRSHFNDLAGLGQFQLNVERHDLTCLHNDSGGPNLSEIFCLHVDGVRPRRHERETVGTVRAGRCRLRNIRADVCDGHRDVGHHGSGRIHDRAGDDALHGL